MPQVSIPPPIVPSQRVVRGCKLRALPTPSAASRTDGVCAKSATAVAARSVAPYAAVVPSQRCGVARLERCRMQPPFLITANSTRGKHCALSIAYRFFYVASYWQPHSAPA